MTRVVTESDAGRLVAGVRAAERLAREVGAYSPGGRDGTAPTAVVRVTGPPDEYDANANPDARGDQPGVAEVYDDAARAWLEVGPCRVRRTDGSALAVGDRVLARYTGPTHDRAFGLWVADPHDVVLCKVSGERTDFGAGAVYPCDLYVCVGDANELRAVGTGYLTFLIGDGTGRGTGIPLPEAERAAYRSPATRMGTTVPLYGYYYPAVADGTVLNGPPAAGGVRPLYRHVHTPFAGFASGDGTARDVIGFNAVTGITGESVEDGFKLRFQKWGFTATFHRSTGTGSFNWFDLVPHEITVAEVFLPVAGASSPPAAGGGSGAGPGGGGDAGGDTGGGDAGGNTGGGTGGGTGGDSWGGDDIIWPDRPPTPDWSPLPLGDPNYAATVIPDEYEYPVSRAWGGGSGAGGVSGGGAGTLTVTPSGQTYPVTAPFTIGVGPFSATGGTGTITWLHTSSNTAVFTVSNETTDTPSVTGVAAGTATLTSTATDSLGNTGTATNTVVVS